MTCDSVTSSFKKIKKKTFLCVGILYYSFIDGVEQQSCETFCDVKLT